MVIRHALICLGALDYKLWFHGCLVGKGFVPFPSAFFARPESQFIVPRFVHLIVVLVRLRWTIQFILNAVCGSSAWVLEQPAYVLPTNCNAHFKSLL